MLSAQAELLHLSLSVRADMGHLVCHALALDVHDLASYQALRAHGLADFAHHLRAPAASVPVPPAAQPAQASPRPLTLQPDQAAVLPAMQRARMQARGPPHTARLRLAATPRSLTPAVTLNPAADPHAGVQPPRTRTTRSAAMPRSL